MSRLFALIVLCGMCICVLSDDNLRKCIFNFQSFEPHKDSKDIILDHSGLGISHLVDGKYKNSYISGEFKLRAKVDRKVRASYSITPLGSNTRAVEGRMNACLYSTIIYPQYLQPIAGKRGDVPPNTTLCDMEPGTTIHLPLIQTTEELVAGSMLGRGDYVCEIYFMKGDKFVGGFKAKFNVFQKLY